MKTITALLISIFICSCADPQAEAEREKKKAEQKQKRVAMLETTGFSDLIPTSDGGFYASKEGRMYLIEFYPRENNPHRITDITKAIAVPK